MDTTFASDIYSVRTGRAIILIGPPDAYDSERDERLLTSGWEASLHIEMALEACGETHGIRQFFARWGLDTHGVAYVGDSGVRAWLFNAVRQGRLGVALLPDVQFCGSVVEARAMATRTNIARRIAQVTPQASVLQQPIEPIELIEALLQPNLPGARYPAGAGNRHPPFRGGESTLADIGVMTLDDRLLEVIRRVLASPAASGYFARQDLTALIDRGRLPHTVAMLAAWADFHDAEAGHLVGLALLALGQAGLERKIISGLKVLARCLARTSAARDAAELQQAATLLARAIDLIGASTMRSLIAYSGTLPASIPAKPRAPAFDRTPQAERLRPRPAPAANAVEVSLAFPAPSQQARALRRAAAKGSSGCKICAARRAARK